MRKNFYLMKIVRFLVVLSLFMRRSKVLKLLH